MTSSSFGTGATGPRTPVRSVLVLAVLTLVTALAPLLAGPRSPAADATPSGGRAAHGYGSPRDGAVTVNGYGGTRSWWGSYDLAGPDGPIRGYCIDHGYDFPSREQAPISDPMPDLNPTNREILAWLLATHGHTASPGDAAAVALLVHDLTAMVDGGTSTWNLDVATMSLGTGWPGQTERTVKARALTLLQRAHRHRGPYTVAVAMTEDGTWPDVTVTVEVTGAAGPIGGHDVDLTFENGPDPVTVTTGADGVARIDLTVPERAREVSVSATLTYHGDTWQTFRGQARTQRVIVPPAANRTANAAATLQRPTVPPQPDRDRQVIIRKRGIVGPAIAMDGYWVGDMTTARYSLRGATLRLLVDGVGHGTFRVFDDTGDDIRQVSGPRDFPGDDDNVRTIPATGRIEVVETRVPWPYQQRAGEVSHRPRFVVRQDRSRPGPVYEIDVVNELFHQDVRLRKVSDTLAYTDAAASFEIWHDRDGDGTYEHPVDWTPGGGSAATPIRLSSQWRTVRLQPGDHELREVPGSQTNGHVARTEPFRFTVGTDPTANQFSVRNDQPRSRARVAKTGQFPTYLPVEGATFVLFHDADNDRDTDHADPNGGYETPVTDVGGVTVQPDGFTRWVEGLRPGRYLWVETAAPPGYAPATAAFSLAVGVSESRTVPIENLAPTTGLRIVKEAVGKPDHQVAGTTFAVDHDADADGTFETAVEDTVVIDASGTATLDGLDPGNYRIIEVMAAEGLLAEAEPTVVFVADGLTEHVSGPGRVTFEDHGGVVTIANTVVTDPVEPEEEPPPTEPEPGPTTPTETDPPPAPDVPEPATPTEAATPAAALPTATPSPEPPAPAATVVPVAAPRPTPALPRTGIGGLWLLVVGAALVSAGALTVLAGDGWEASP